MGLYIPFEGSFELRALNGNVIVAIAHIALEFEVFVVSDVYCVFQNG